MARTNEWTETLVDWVDGRLRQNRFSNLWLGGGAGADGGSSYRPIDGQLTQRHVCYDTSETALPCSPSGFSSLVDNLRRIRYWQEPATWFGVTTSGAPPSGSSLNVYIKPGLWYPSTTEYCAFAGGHSPTFTLPGVLDRVDTVYVDASGILHIQRGTPAVSPTITLPPIASGIPLWAVHLTPTSSGITHVECSGYYAGMGYIERDLRPFLNLGGGGAVASGVLPASNRGAILRGGVADWETYNVGATNEVLTNDGTDVIWSTGAINLTAGKTLVVSVNLTLTGVDGKSLTIEENSILNQDLTTDASVTFADVFVPDGGTFGISGNELLTVNAAGNFTFSGVASVVVPDGAWVGADADCAWLFDSWNGRIYAQDFVGVGGVPHTTLEPKNNTAFDTAQQEVGQDNIMLASTVTTGQGNYGSSIVFDRLNGNGNYRRAAIVAVQTGGDSDQIGLQFFTHPSNNGVDPIVTAVRIDHNGNVSIGVTTANQKLTVEGTIDLKEQAAAGADVASYGQVWVKNTDPNELWFTDDTGTDMQLGLGAGGLPAVAGAGYALVSDGVDSWVADQTPLWTGEHSFEVGIAFTGASDANEITIPDDTAIALELLDAGGLEYLRIVSTNANPYFLIDPAGGEINVGVGIATPGNAHVYIYDDTLNSTATFYGIRSYHVKTAGAGAATDDYYGIHSAMVLNQATTIDEMYGAVLQAILLTGTLDWLVGTYVLARVTSGTVNEGVRGVYSFADINSGTINGKIYGLYADVDIEAAATCNDTIYGAFIQVDDDDNTSTSYMVYLEELSNVDYGFYQNGTAPNRFGGHVDPASASGQDLGDATHRWDLYTQDIIFGGATGANVITVPDNIADALGLLDTGGLEYMRIVSTNANPYFLIDPAAAGVKVGVGIATPDGTMHVHTATAGAVAANAGADDLVVENSASGGISILVPNASDANIYFGTPLDSVGALIRWTYATPRLLMGTAAAGGTVVLCSANAVTGIHIDANQQVGIACIPNSRFEIRLATKNLEIVNAGTAGASFNHWIEVEIGGTQAYIRVYATK